MNAKIERYMLIGIGVFAAVSALGGGYGVASTNGLGMPQVWLRTTPFADYMVPGLILLFVVGGSSLVATVLALRRHPWQYMAMFAAGAIMSGWIVGEVLLIRQTYWLQAVYLLVGLAMMGLALFEEIAIYRHTHRLVPQHIP